MDFESSSTRGKWRSSTRWSEQIVCDYPDWTNHHLCEENGGLSSRRYREDESSSPGNAVEGGRIGEDLPKKRARRRTAWDEGREREWRKRKRMERERIKRTRWQPGGGGKNKKWHLSGDAEVVPVCEPPKKVVPVFERGKRSCQYLMITLKVVPLVNPKIWR